MTIDYLLAYACPSEAPDENGWAKYWIETHCLGFWISARKVAEGVWDDDADDWGTTPRYEVLGWSTETV